MKSVIKDKTPSNILKRLQGNMRVQLGKAKRLFKGSTRDTQGERLSQVLTMESVELGLRLESYLQMAGQLKRGAFDDEGECERSEGAVQVYKIIFTLFRIIDMSFL